METISFTASEEMLFETDDDGWTKDAYLYYKLTNEPSTQVSWMSFLQL